MGLSEKFFLHTPVNASESLDSQGYVVISDVLSSSECKQLLVHTSSFDTRSRSSRTVLSRPWCQEVVKKLKQHPVIQTLLSADAVAVQCTYFEKSTNCNWLVPIHQDLSVPVAQRIDHPELYGWSEKEGQSFFQPPLHIMQNMLALRLHLEPCTEDDGPLRVFPGTHGEINTSPESSTQIHGETLTVDTGAVIAMRPLTWHASSKAIGHSKRRLLHFLMGPATLPYGLQWAQAL